MNIEAFCAVPPKATAHSPCQMPLSCPVAPLSQRELHKDGGGGGGGGVARRARAARVPKAGSSAALSATSCATCLSFTCRLRAALGAACVCWVRVPLLEADARHDKNLINKEALCAAPPCTRICPYPFFEVTPSGAAPGPRLKPGPVFVASGGAISGWLRWQQLQVGALELFCNPAEPLQAACSQLPEIP